MLIMDIENKTGKKALTWSKKYYINNYEKIERLAVKKKGR